MGKIRVRAVNVNFILMIIVIILLTFFAYFCWQLTEVGDAELAKLKTSIDETMDGDVIEDVEGYGLIFSGIGYGLGSLANAFAKIFLVIVPMLFVVYLGIFTVIGRIVYAPTKKRLLAYRILMGFDYAGLTFFAYSISELISFDFEDKGNIFLLLVELFIFFILFINIRNTYSGRIRK